MDELLFLEPRSDLDQFIVGVGTGFGGNIALVKRLGRWASDAFEGYIWEDRELTKGLSSKMIAAPWHVHGAA